MTIQRIIHFQKLYREIDTKLFIHTLMNTLILIMVFEII